MDRIGKDYRDKPIGHLFNGCKSSACDSGSGIRADDLQDIHV